MAVLGSGSGGNATLVRHQDTLLLVDAGLSAKQLILRMQHLGINPDQLDGILLTHEHSDHARGVDVLLRKLQIPVYVNALTREALSHRMRSQINWRIFRSGQQFSIRNLDIQAFRIPHDAAEPVGFTLTGSETKLSMLSDVGYVTELIRENLRGSDGIYVEANYDDHLLEIDTKRPWATKQRIASRHGHLSNAQTAELICEVACNKLQAIMLCHLSGDCNTPELAVNTLGSHLEKKKLTGVSIHCAEQATPSPWIKIGKTPNPISCDLSKKTSEKLLQETLF